MLWSDRCNLKKKICFRNRQWESFTDSKKSSNREILLKQRMEETMKWKKGYHIQREVMDELKIDEIAKKSDVHTSLFDKIKGSMR